LDGPIDAIFSLLDLETGKYQLTHPLSLADIQLTLANGKEKANIAKLVH
jgi:cell division protein YceG involved in septum cleavage